MKPRDIPRASLLPPEVGVLRVPEAIAASICERWSQGVQAGRADWTCDFEGAQYCLGRAWYTHLETGKSRDYFAGTAAADALVETHAPGLQTSMRELAERLLDAPVIQRARWCGAGVHIFPAAGELASRGGDVHFDTEGLTPVQIREGARAYSFILMLQPPTKGGALAVWNERYGTAREARPSTAPVMINYEVGTLVVLDSYRLHQIQPFAGERDRISATLHVAKTPAGWESWF